MSDTVAGLLQIALLCSVLTAVYVPFGDYLARVYSSATHLGVDGGTQVIPGGPVASQEVLKELGTNGGGFFNANSAHPFEDPTARTSLVGILLILLVPVALTRTYGTMLARAGARTRRHGLALLAAMGVISTLSLAGSVASEAGAHGDVARAAGAAVEGKETRFGEWLSALFATSTTSTSTGAVNSFHQ